MRIRTFGPWLRRAFVCGLPAGLALVVVAPAAGLVPVPTTDSSRLAKIESSDRSVPLEPVPEASRLDVASSTRPTSALVSSIDRAATRAVLLEVLANDPEIAQAERLAAAAAARAPQVRALPDPVAALRAFLAPVETRVGPQVATLSLRQTLPWFGKLRLAERAALLSAVVAEAEVEEVRLERVSEARRLLYELAFLDRREAILESERSVLRRAESLAHARYVSGSGVQQSIVRLQAELTRIDARKLEIAQRRATLASGLSRLGTTLSAVETDPFGETLRSEPMLRPEAMPPLDPERLLAVALARRPSITARDAEIAAESARGDLAALATRADVTVGVSYTLVDPRGSVDGLAAPRGDGDDIVALEVSVPLPVWRRKIAAGIEEAAARRRAAEAARRQEIAEIEAVISDSLARIPLLAEHLELLEGVLLKQARRALESAESSYAAGSLQAVDLLDAERVLFELHVAAERARADLAIARAELERAIASPLAEAVAASISEVASPDVMPEAAGEPEAAEEPEASGERDDHDS